MTKPATISVSCKVKKLAATYNVTAERDAMSRMALAITRMSGDVVVLDNVEQLLVNLKKKGVLNKSEILMLQRDYLLEKRESLKNSAHEL